MTGNYGAIAEGFFPGIGVIDSVGKAGVDEAGNLRSDACMSEQSARRRAIIAVVNRLRYRCQDWTIGMDFPHIPNDYKTRLVNEVTSIVRWEIIDDKLSRAIGIEAAIIQSIPRGVE